MNVLIVRFSVSSYPQISLYNSVDIIYSVLGIEVSFMTYFSHPYRNGLAGLSFSADHSFHVISLFSSPLFTSVAIHHSFTVTLRLKDYFYHFFDDTTQIDFTVITACLVCLRVDIKWSAK